SHGTHLPRCESREPLRKSCQAGEAALRGLIREKAFGVQSAAQADGLLEIVDASITAQLNLADLEAEAVGTQVDRGQLARPSRSNGLVVFGNHGAHCRGNLPGLRDPGLSCLATFRSAAPF